MAGRSLSRKRFQVPRQVSPSQRDSRSRSRPRDHARVPPREPSRQPVQVFAEDQPGPSLRTRPGTSESQTSIAQPGQGQDLFDTAQMTELLQRNPNINAPILRQLVEELQRVRDEPQHAETEVPQPPQTTDYNVLLHGNPMWNEPFIRPPTTLERIIALARRSNPEQAMRRADDHETQLASLPPQDRQVLLLLQRLTIASNPTTLFDTRHLSAHDFLHVDAFLRSDLHRTIRSYFTKEIFIPNWELNQDTTYPQVALYEIAHNLQGVQQLSQQLLDYTAQLSHQQQMPAEPALLFEQIVQLHRFIDNINERHVALLTHFQNTHFRQDDPPPYLADLLAYYNIHFADFQATSATATAAIAEARRVLDDLVRLHREQMRTTLDTVQAVRDVAQPPRAPARPLLQQRPQPLRAPPAMQAAQPPQTLPATRPRRDPTPSRPQAPPLVRRPPSRSPSHEPRGPLQQVAPRAARPEAPSVETEFSPSEGVPSVETDHGSSSTQAYAESEYAYSVGTSHRPRSRSRESQVQAAGPYSMPWQPAEVPKRARCFFCAQLHFSSGCPNVTSLRRRIEIHANNGRCFICGGDDHGEEQCEAQTRCRACRARDHHTAFCLNNRHADGDIAGVELQEYLDQAKAYARRVRAGDIEH